MSGELEYRPAHEEDLAGILELYCELNPEDTPLDFDRALSIWRSSEAAGLTKYLVAAEDGAIVSTCCVTVVPNLTRGGRPYAIIENVITDKSRRRRGIGARVMRDAIEFARKRDCYKVVLLSSSKRKEAHEFYEALGFDGNSKKGFEIRF